MFCSVSDAIAGSHVVLAEKKNVLSTFSRFTCCRFYFMTNILTDQSLVSLCWILTDIYRLLFPTGSLHMDVVGSLLMSLHRALETS